jgi:hypothetical protein
VSTALPEIKLAILRLCRNCKWAVNVQGATYLNCCHPNVVAKDPKALAASQNNTSSASDARAFRDNCGPGGYFWELYDEQI